ncbi:MULTISPECIES: LLM class flavin-dependent oxidoreductase [Bacillus]|uniref:Alkanesulfonate monooxygenase SsuD/methylene tetrahydromethanopterin reductase-like flavin-dependent oxidoreductase (Luciferase family) n=1 Tax=Bacillus mycoides TaxID=1405 RepID=A0A3D9UUA8_BACMY|nr:MULTISPECIES: LLM class flavin-dependent oxidoreductase [Bacillus]RBP20186.1 alkanesulfonate monooxygenase SsuD/methylene tetrahydromethanopterin reductase-like flavin-dependent oxidoreductase (luciferase family) [Bacillus sp. DB-2]REF33092.1 alkanesulfonate monooxygenase SsuD/methylene tetrahydromethanopterin reductase-like flavin-dependent oxidoreductase (luciferase family) [Bacillus mycoides]
MEKYRIDTSKGIEFGLYSIGDHILNPHNGSKISAEKRIHELIETAKLADEAGIDVFAVGESHQAHFTTQAHTVILGAIAQATKNIKIASSATVLSTSDPVRVYEDFATIDLISSGRAEIVAGRGSRIGGYSLLGYDVNYYEELFEEKMDLLLKINKEESVTWKGQFRTPLEHAAIIPRAKNNNMPIWRAVGGPPASAIKAGRAGVPMMLTTLGGPAVNFKVSVDAYREAAEQSGFDPATLPIATTSLFYTAENSQDALSEYYPHINAGMLALRGGGYPKQQFTNAVDHRDALMIGSPQQIIEKMLYQYELFGQQRFMAQIDFGGVPFDKIEKNIELIATEIMPAVRKYTTK